MGEIGEAGIFQLFLSDQGLAGIIQADNFDGLRETFSTTHDFDILRKRWYSFRIKHGLPPLRGETVEARAAERKQVRNLRATYPVLPWHWLWANSKSAYGGEHLADLKAKVCHRFQQGSKFAPRVYVMPRGASRQAVIDRFKGICPVCDRPARKWFIREGLVPTCYSCYRLCGLVKSVPVALKAREQRLTAKRESEALRVGLHKKNAGRAYLIAQLGDPPLCPGCRDYCGLPRLGVGRGWVLNRGTGYLPVCKRCHAKGVKIERR